MLNVKKIYPCFRTTRRWCAEFFLHGCSAVRAIRFICSCIRLRSISRAIWLDKFDTFKPGHGK